LCPPPKGNFFSGVQKNLVGKKDTGKEKFSVINLLTLDYSIVVILGDEMAWDG